MHGYALSGGWQQHTSASAMPNTTDLHAAAAASVMARCHRLSPAGIRGTTQCCGMATYCYTKTVNLQEQPALI